MKNIVLISITLLFSVFIGYSDLGQTDAPITVAMILVAGFVVGLFVEKRPWAYGIIIGLGVPIAGLVAAYFHLSLSGLEQGQIKTWYANYDSAGISLVTVPIAILSLYLGQAARKLAYPMKVS